MGLQYKCQVQRLCFGEELFKNIYVYTDMNTYVEHFSKTQYTNLGLTFETLFLGGGGGQRRLSRFGKKSSLYLSSIYRMKSRYLFRFRKY